MSRPIRPENLDLTPEEELAVTSEAHRRGISREHLLCKLLARRRLAALEAEGIGREKSVTPTQAWFSPE